MILCIVIIFESNEMIIWHYHDVPVPKDIICQISHNVMNQNQKAKVSCPLCIISKPYSTRNQRSRDRGSALDGRGTGNVVGTSGTAGHANPQPL